MIVVEGYMDVIALAQAGIDEAVAPLGTALTEAAARAAVAAWPTCRSSASTATRPGRRRRSAPRCARCPMLAPGPQPAFVTLPAGPGSRRSRPRRRARGVRGAARRRRSRWSTASGAHELAAEPLDTPEAARRPQAPPRRPRRDDRRPRRPPRISRRIPPAASTSISAAPARFERPCRAPAPRAARRSARHWRRRDRPRHEARRSAAGGIDPLLAGRCSPG